MRLTPGDLRSEKGPPLRGAVAPAEIAQRFGRTGLDTFQRVPAVKAGIARLEPSFFEAVSAENGRRRRSRAGRGATTEACACWIPG